MKVSGNNKQKGLGEKKIKMFGFRLDSSTRKDLDEVVENLAGGNRTDFFKNSIRFFKDNPELYHQGKVQTADNLVTKDDLENTKLDILSYLNQQMRVIQEMAQLVQNQRQNGVKIDQLEDMKEALLSYDQLAELDDYGKVEGFLFKTFPEWETSIVADKLYNEVLLELMQDGKLVYDTRLKNLNWRVNS